jgi:hypothetical protein
MVWIGSLFFFDSGNKKDAFLLTHLLGLSPRQKRETTIIFFRGKDFQSSKRNSKWPPPQNSR